MIRGLELKGSLGYPEGTVITRVPQYARGGRRAKAKEKLENRIEAKRYECADKPSECWLPIRGCWKNGSFQTEYHSDGFMLLAMIRASELQACICVSGEI